MPGPGNGRGGKRPGAGRKPTGRSTVAVACRIGWEDYEVLVELAAKQCIPVSEWARRQLVSGGRGLAATRARRKKEN